MTTNEKIKTFLRYTLVLLVLILLGNVLYKILDQPRQESNQPPEQLDTANCPKMLLVDYQIDNNNTAPVTDDLINISVRNDELDAHYQLKVFVDDAYEGDLILEGRKQAILTSSILTSWWREGKNETKAFTLTLESPGCKSINYGMTSQQQQAEQQKRVGLTGMSGGKSAYKGELKGASKYIGD